MTVLQICGAGVLVAVAIILLKDAKAPHPEALTAVFALLVLGRVVMNTDSVVSFISDMSYGTEAVSHIAVLLKGAGIAFTVELTAELCRDAGEDHIAGYVELFGKSELIVLTLPVIDELLGMSLGLLKI